MKNPRTNKKGFTLIELLVAIAIMGILTSVVLALTNSHKGRSRDARRVSELHSIKDAVELYFEENGNFPTSLSDVASTFNGQLPDDPLTGDPYDYVRFTDTAKKYCLSATLEYRAGSGSCSTSIGNIADERYIITGP